MQTPPLIENELDFLSESVPLASADVLEIGCGAGDFAQKLVAAFPASSVVGVEADPRQHDVNAGRQLTGIQFMFGTAQHLPLASQSFDAALMLKSLHHVPADAMDTALKEVARVLRDDGCLYVSEPVFDGPLNEVIRLFHDEEQVRAEAQLALDRAMNNGEWDQQFDQVFMTPVVFKDFAEFERRIILATFADHRLSDELKARVQARFDAHMGPDGAHFVRPMRVRLLRKCSLQEGEVAKSFSVTIPHELGQAEAERRIRAGIDNFKSSFGSMAQVTREQWKDGVLEFEMNSMHQHCQGKVVILPNCVQMDLMLPALLAMMAGKIRDAVVRKGSVLLEDKRT